MIDFGLLKTGDSQSYLGPLQALALGRQAKTDQLTAERSQRTLQARDQALKLYQAGDVDKAYNAAFSGGDFETAEKLRTIQARSAAGDVIRQYGPPGAAPVPLAAPAPAMGTGGASPAVSGLISAQPQPRMIDLPGMGNVPLSGQSVVAGGGGVTTANASAPDPAATSPLVNHDHPATIAAGQAISHGQMNPTEAWAHLYQLDPEMGDKMMGAVKGMDALRLSRLAESNDAIAAAAQTLKELPPGARAAAAQHMLPALAAHGVTPEMVGDLSDSALAGYIGQAVGVKGMIENAQKERTYGLDVRKQNEVERHGMAEDSLGVRRQTFEESKPMSVGADSALVRPGGEVVYGEGAPSVGERNNNPGNIRDGAFARSQPGYLGPGEGGFARFSDADLGGKAQEALLSSAYLGKGVNTVNAIVNRYAPGGENSPASQANYKQYVAQKLGIGVNDKVPPAKVPELAAAMREFETGNRPGGKQDDPGVSQDALELAAAQYLHLGTMPTGLGRKGVTQRAVINKAAEMAKVGGQSPDQVFANWQTYKAQQKTLNAFSSGTEAKLVRSLNVTVDHLDTMQNAAQALQNGKVPLFNSVAQHWARATGRAAPTNFEAVRQIVTGEVAKAINAGALADRQELAHNIATSSSPEQLAGYIAEVKRLMAGQLGGLASQYKSGTGRDDFNAKLSDRTRRALGSGEGGGGGHPADIAAILQKYGR